MFWTIVGALLFVGIVYPFAMKLVWWFIRKMGHKEFRETLFLRLLITFAILALAVLVVFFPSSHRILYFFIFLGFMSGLQFFVNSHKILGKIIIVLWVIFFLGMPFYYALFNKGL